MNEKLRQFQGLYLPQKSRQWKTIREGWDGQRDDLWKQQEILKRSLTETGDGRSEQVKQEERNFNGSRDAVIAETKTKHPEAFGVLQQSLQKCKSFVENLSTEKITNGKFPPELRIIKLKFMIAYASGEQHMWHVANQAECIKDEVVEFDEINQPPSGDMDRRKKRDQCNTLADTQITWYMKC